MILMYDHKNKNQTLGTGCITFKIKLKNTTERGTLVLRYFEVLVHHTEEGVM